MTLKTRLFLLQIARREISFVWNLREMRPRVNLYQTWVQDRPPETHWLTLVTEVVELVGPDRPLENCQQDIICWNFKEENFQARISSEQKYTYKSTEIFPFHPPPLFDPLFPPISKKVWHNMSEKVQIQKPVV